MNHIRITQTNTPRNKRELITTPRHRMIDAEAARRFLTGTARLLTYAAESADSRELIAGLDLLRKIPASLPGLEVR
jgi:hypothetical protein